jgi:hypothetical protein
MFSHIFQKESPLFSIRRLSCNGTGVYFAGSNSISRAGHCTCKRHGLKEAMVMPIARAENRFVLAWEMFHPIHE